MNTVGIICEYNPFHNGHAKQLSAINGVTVCLMSGNYVQRGEPALLDKYTRAKSAVLCGADLVLELPLTYAISSAEGFARGGVEVLTRLGCIDRLCFGSESGEVDIIMSTARLLLTELFRAALRSELASGVSFPRARQNAVETLGGSGSVLENPNDILAVEYCKALLMLQSPIEPMTLRREGSYHESLQTENPSASVLRTMADWRGFVPEKALEVFEAAPRYTVQAGERAWLARLRAMEEAEFEMLPYGSEGLWRKVMQACRTEATLEGILEAAKSKRYTHSRLKRMLLCAFLGISAEMLQCPAPYVRVLALNEKGAAVVREARKYGTIPVINAGERPPDAQYAELERRASALYGLFREGLPAVADTDARERVFVLQRNDACI